VATRPSKTVRLAFAYSEIQGIEVAGKVCECDPAIEGCDPVLGATL
jgi:hypothetical protein